MAALRSRLPATHLASAPIDFFLSPSQNTLLNSKLARSYALVFFDGADLPAGFAPGLLPVDSRRLSRPVTKLSE